MYIIIGISDGVDDVMCRCFFSGPIPFGTHNVSFLARLNGDIRGQATSTFITSSGKLFNN